MALEIDASRSRNTGAAWIAAARNLGCVTGMALLLAVGAPMLESRRRARLPARRAGFDCMAHARVACIGIGWRVACISIGWRVACIGVDCVARPLQRLYAATHVAHPEHRRRRRAPAHGVLDRPGVRHLRAARVRPERGPR